MTFGKLLAGAIFDNQWQSNTFETVLLYSLSKPFRDQLEFKRFDYYDASVEFWSYPGHDLDEVDRDVLWTLGFERCWVCYQEPGSEGGERGTGEEHFYSAKGHAHIRPPVPSPEPPRARPDFSAPDPPPLCYCPEACKVHPHDPATCPNCFPSEPPREEPPR